MPIKSWPTSAKKELVFQAGLDRFIQLKRLPGRPAIQLLLPVYHVGVRDVLQNNSVDAFQNLVSWRFLATGAGDEAAIAGEVCTSHCPRLLNISRGPSVSKTLKAVGTAETLHPDFREFDYEPRLLRFPGLLLECLWLSRLTPAGAAAGWVIPYNSLIPSLPGTLVAANAFYAEIKTVAEKAFAKG
jgi:hypothetical protein